MKVPLAILLAHVYSGGRRLPKMLPWKKSEVKSSQLERIKLLYPEGISRESKNPFLLTPGMRRYFKREDPSGTLCCRLCGKRVPYGEEPGSHYACWRGLNAIISALQDFHRCMCCDAELGRTLGVNGLPICDKDTCLQVWDWSLPQAFRLEKSLYFTALRTGSEE